MMITTKSIPSGRKNTTEPSRTPMRTRPKGVRKEPRIEKKNARIKGYGSSNHVHVFAACVIVASTFAIAMAGMDAMTPIAREYVRLVLALGQHDKDYVDAYYGPDDLTKEADSATLTLDAIGAGVTSLQAQVRGLRPPADELGPLRHQYLEKPLSAMSAPVRMLKRESPSFDQ